MLTCSSSIISFQVYVILTSYLEPELRSAVYLWITTAGCVYFEVMYNVHSAEDLNQV